ncbi:MAG: VanW family protein [Firmicutes bacterium]|nr:VanW family protein [Bacillota bacterium]
MSKGKFSNPRPYREEEREIEKSFRQLTGQEPPQGQEPRQSVPPDAETEAELQFTDPETADLLSEADSLIPDAEEPFPEGGNPPVKAAPSFLEKLVTFVEQNRKPVMVAACAVALVLIVSIIAIFFVSVSSDPYGNKILNNVTIAGVNVGGMRKSDAVTAVRKVTDQTYPKQDMVITLGDTEIRLSPDDTDVKLDVKAAVNAAYDYGRTGTQAQREEAYAASLRGNHAIDLLPYLKLDTDYIRGVLEDYAGTTGGLVSETTYALEGDIPDLSADKFDETHAPELTLVITIGAPGGNFDVEALYGQILDAYSQNRFSVEIADADPGTEPEPVDLQKIFDEICVEPVDATVDMRSYKAVPGSYGYEFDLTLAQKLVSGARYGEVVRIPMEYVAPEILGDDVFFRDVLGTARTSFSDGSSRASNLKLACLAINGTVLNPGDTFSFNETVGERTAARGYRSAVCAGSQAEEAGGGVCQVASTLYCSALTADLEIVSRTAHSFPTGYIDYGMDVDVGWRSPDFQFRNTTNYPIQILAEVSGSNLTVQILGTEEREYYVELSYVISNTLQPETEYKTFQADNPEGYRDGDVIQEGTTGYLVKTYQSKYDRTTGALISKDFAANTQYKTVNRIVAKVEAPPTEAPTLPPTQPTTQPTEPSAAPEPEPSSAPTEAPPPSEEDAPQSEEP